MATALLIMEAVSLPTMTKRRQNLLSGQRKININKEITLYLHRHLSSRSVQPSDVASVQVVVGGDHGDTAFQLGTSIAVELNDTTIIDFEVSVCELICRKDTAKLIEQTILPRLTNRLEVVATMPLHITTDKDGLLQCRFSHTPPVGKTPHQKSQCTSLVIWHSKPWP